MDLVCIKSKKHNTSTAAASMTQNLNLGPIILCKKWLQVSIPDTYWQYI